MISSASRVTLFCSYKLIIHIDLWHNFFLDSVTLDTVLFISLVDIDYLIIRVMIILIQLLALNKINHYYYYYYYYL